MSLSISPQMKIVALVGLLAALALAGGMTLLGRSQSSSSAATSTVPLGHFTPKPGTPAARAAATKTAVAKPGAATTSAATTPAPTATVAAQPVVAPKPPVAPNGLPTVLDELLHTHRIVVVAIYDPEVPSEATIALPEARAGALDANAGFLAVSVLDERVAGPLTAAAGHGTILPDPGILVYRQPWTLMNTISGFADREAVAEAVANALSADAPVVIPATPAAPSTPSVTPTLP